MSEVGSLVESLRRAGSTLLAIGQTRLELISTEVEEERARLSALLLHAYLTIGCLSIGVLLAALVFVVAWWPRDPIVAVAVPAFLFCAGGVWSMVRMRTLLRAKPRLFAASIDELAKDRAALR
jgi:uncharacterized membrane protein YqjE